jgi:O-antigen/teichoic acid export membrane protein
VRIRSIAGLGAWALSDQLLSSGTNFAVGIVIARSIGPEGLGSFTLAFGGWLLMLGFLRAFITQPYMVAASGSTETDWRDDTASAAGAQLVLGLAAGVSLVIAGLVIGVTEPTGGALVAVGVFAAPLAVQDFWRFAAFSRRMPRKAVANDGVWAIIQFAALGILLVTDALTAATAMSAWGMGALAGALVGIAQFRIWPIPGRVMRAWVRRHAALGGWMALASGIYAVGSYAVLIMLSSLGRKALGGWRSTMNLFAPAQLVAISGESIMLPTAVRMVKNGERDKLQATCVLYSLGLAGCFGAAGGALLLAGSDVYRLVFGSQFAHYAVLVPPVLAQTIAAGLTSGASVGIRALAHGRRMAELQVFTSGMRVIFVATVLSSGLTAAIWAVAVADMASAGLAWALFRSALKGPRPIEAIPPPTVPLDGGHAHITD